MARTRVAFAAASALLLAACGGGTGNSPQKREGTPLAANGLIAFARDGRVFVVRSGGAAPTRLSPAKRSSAGPYFGQPAWSPDGSKLAVIRVTYPTHEYAELLVGDVRDARITRLQTLAREGSAISGDPAWSPDGRRIVYGGADEFSGLSVLRLVAPPSRPTVLPLPEYAETEDLGEKAFSDEGPAWSPDGRKICFARNDWTVSEQYDLYIAEADGRPVKALGVSGYAPDWSPDGREIAFVRDGDVYVVEADGSAERRVTETSEIETGPSWSPDGTRILFAREDRSGRRNRSGEWPTDVWMIASDGSGEKRLIRRASHPDWQPIPGA